MKKIIFVLFVCFASYSIAQERIRVPANMLMQIKIPIKPDDKLWVYWNMMPSLQDSSKLIRVDRLVKGYAPFIPRHDAPNYSSSQVKEIQHSLEKILNPDGYFATQEEFMQYYQEFLNNLVYKNVPQSK